MAESCVCCEMCGTWIPLSKFVELRFDRHEGLNRIISTRFRICPTCMEDLMWKFATTTRKGDQNDREAYTGRNDPPAQGAVE